MQFAGQAGALLPGHFHTGDKSYWEPARALTGFPCRQCCAWEGTDGF